MSRVSSSRQATLTSQERPNLAPTDGSPKEMTPESLESRRGVTGPPVDFSWHLAFLDILRRHGVVKQACMAVGKSQSIAYLHRSTQPDFAEAWSEAIDESTALLEVEAFNRATTGQEVPIMKNGVRVGAVTRKSDYLLLALLKARSDRYKGQVTLTGQDRLSLGARVQAGELEGYREVVRKSLEGKP